MQMKRGISQLPPGNVFRPKNNIGISRVNTSKIDASVEFTLSNPIPSKSTPSPTKSKQNVAR